MPALAVADGKLFLSYKGSNSDTLYWATLDSPNGKWSDSERLNETSKVHPSLAGLDDQLLMLHLGQRSNDIYQLSFDRDWGKSDKFGGSSKAVPAAATGDNEIHVVYVGNRLPTMYHRICRL
jgi:hypothetical protein